MLSHADVGEYLVVLLKCGEEVDHEAAFIRADALLHTFEDFHLEVAGEEVGHNPYDVGLSVGERTCEIIGMIVQLLGCLEDFLFCFCGNTA